MSDGASTHLSYVELGKVLFKSVFLDQEIQEVSSTHIFEYLDGISAKWH